MEETEEKRRPKSGSSTRSNVHEVEQEIIDSISKGVWLANERLPTERELSARFGAARNTVRKAIQSIESQGLIVRRGGQGAYVVEGQGQASPGQGEGVPFEVQVAPLSPAEVLESRLVIEPALAKLLAVCSTNLDVKRIEECHAKCQAATSLQEFEEWDARFHSAVVAASGNTFIISAYQSLTNARYNTSWGQLKERSATLRRRTGYNREHLEIIEAIKQRDAPRIARAIENHLLGVRNNMLGI